jgi:hypothetical protein
MYMHIFITTCTCTSSLLHVHAHLHSYMFIIYRRVGMPFTVKVSNVFSHFHKVPYRSDIFVVIHQICFSELPSLAIRMFFKYSSWYFQIRYLRLY